MRFVSIVGDSISTYEGYNPQGYSVYYNEEMQKKNGLKSVYDTWWAKVNQALYGLLCVNNSYSGSKVSGEKFPAAISEQRMNTLKAKEYSPDYILVYIGFNDFANGVPISMNPSKNSLNINYSTFEEAYDIMLQKIISRNPMTKIICGTIMRTEIRGRNNWSFPEYYAGIGLEEYNDVIRRITKKNKCIVADVSSLDMMYETLDGSHPTANGHRTIADAWIKCLADLNLLEPSIEVCIKRYNANRENNICFALILEALLKEKVLILLNESGTLVWMNHNNKIVIPVFTSPNEVKNKALMRICTVFLSEHIEKIKKMKLDILVNPFSQPNKQCVIPYTTLF